MINENDFQPPWWLRNSHIQSCYSVLTKSRSVGLIEWEELALPDGDFVDLCWAGEKDNPIIILLHGLEGSVQSWYMQFMIDELIKSGFCTVTLHFRTCGGRNNKLSRTYHAGDTADLDYLVNYLSLKFPQVHLAALGFSMGGNVLLKYCSEQPLSPLKCIACVSVPFKIDKSIDGLTQIYEWRFLRSMKAKIAEKIRVGQLQPVDMDELKKINTMRMFDNMVTAPMFGFIDADHYYHSSSCKPRLSMIEHNTLILHSLDDPFVPEDSIPNDSELAANIEMHVSKHGGHIGFVDGGLPWRPQCMMGELLCNFFQKNI
jgi:predicted alpha/beta-fold hydrolase